MKNSKFDRLYKTIMEEVKASKKHIIKESWHDEFAKFEQILDKRLTQCGIEVDNDTYDYFIKLWNGSDIDYTNEQLEEMDDEQFKEWATSICDEWEEMVNEDYDEDRDFVAWVKELKQKNMDKYDIIRKNLRDYIEDNYDGYMDKFEDEGCLLDPEEWKEFGADLTGMRPCPNNLMPNDLRYASWCEDYMSQYLSSVAALFDLDPDDLEDI